MSEPQSEFEFDHRRTLVFKLARSFLLVLAAGFFAIFTVIVFFGLGDSWWVTVLKIAIEICWTFWFLAVLYVWFQWPWLRNLYLHSERRIIRLMIFLKWAIPFITAGILVFIWYLHKIGVLPVAMK